MAVSEKGILQEVNELLANHSVQGIPEQVDLSGYDAYRAEYAATHLHGKLDDPVLRGLKIGIAVFGTMSHYAAIAPHVDTGSMYRLATQETPRHIEAYRLNLPEREPQAARSIRIKPEAALSVLVNHDLWLASNDVKSRRGIPEALEKRLAASKRNPARHLGVAVSAAVEHAANIAASVKSFEERNGIANRRNNVAGYAVYGYSMGDYMRLTRMVDARSVGQY